MPNLMSPSNKAVGNSSHLLGTIPNLKTRVNFASTKDRGPVHKLTFKSFGVEFTLLANEAQLLQDALAYLPLESEPCDSSAVPRHYSFFHRSNLSKSCENSYTLARDGRQIYTSADRPDLLEHFAAIVSLDVAEASSIRTFVHAGVVGWGKTAILIPGRTFSGKTTLVVELIRAGAVYYSDEFAVIDELGMVHPYARPLQVRKSGSDRQSSHPPQEFGAITGTRSLPVGLVIVSRYAPKAHWRPKRLSPGIGLLKILDNTVSARRSPAVVLSTLKQVVSSALIVRGVRDEASQVVKWINEQLGSQNRPDEPTL